MKYGLIWGLTLLALAVLATGETRARFSTAASIDGNEVRSGTWHREGEEKCKKKDKEEDHDLELTSGRNGNKVFWKLKGCGVKKHKHYKYKIRYHARADNDDMEKGMGGEGEIGEDGEVGVDNLLLGSCSDGGQCSVDNYHGQMTVEVELDEPERRVSGGAKLSDD